MSKTRSPRSINPIRFYVMNTDVPRILISHAASYWLGLVRVLCDNKAPRIKRQVASIDKKSDLKAKSGHFRTSTSNSASSSQKKADDTENGHFRKRATFQVQGCTVSRMPNYKKGRRPLERDLAEMWTVSDGEQHSQDEPSVTTGKGTKDIKTW